MLSVVDYPSLVLRSLEKEGKHMLLTLTMRRLRWEGVVYQSPVLRSLGKEGKLVYSLANLVLAPKQVEAEVKHLEVVVVAKQVAVAVVNLERDVDFQANLVKAVEANRVAKGIVASVFRQ